MAIILVTGGNRGIGYAIAKSVGTRLPQSTIILGCRDANAGREAAQQLQNEGIAAAVDVVEVDIESDRSIAAAAKAVEQRHGKLDGKKHGLKRPSTIPDFATLTPLLS